MSAVRHNPSASRFEVIVDGHECVADYRVEGDRMIFTHTFVHPSLRGRGIAAELMEPALAYAREHLLKVVPLCSYVEAYLKRHPEYSDLRAD